MYESFKTKDIIKHEQVMKEYVVEKVPCNLGGYKYYIKCHKCDNKCLKMYISEDKKLVCSTCRIIRINVGKCWNKIIYKVITITTLYFIKKTLLLSSYFQEMNLP